MNNTEPIYSGRKIRFEGQDELKEDSVKEEGKTESKTKPETDVIMTFGEACSKGWLKPGMAVVFKSCDFAPIELDKEITGQEQQVTCSLDKGVVVKNREGQLEIFAILNTPTIVLKGRVARISTGKIMSFIVSQISEQLRNSAFHITDPSDLWQFCLDNYLVWQFIQEKRLAFCGCFGVKYSKGDRWVEARVNSHIINTFTPDFKLEGNNYYRYIAICLAGKDLEVSLKKGKKKTIRGLHTFEENPYEIYLEIGGSVT